MTISVKQALEDRSERPDDLIASGPQVDMIFKRGQKALSLRAQKIWHLLIKKAGVAVGDDKPHTMSLATLYEVGHMTQTARLEALRELMTTLVQVRVVEDGKVYEREGALLSNVDRPLDERGQLRWQFGPALRTIFANSDHWAILSKRAVMAFESRYSLRLYEIVALRSGLEHKTNEVFELETLRDRLGVPAGKLERWIHFKQFALEPAIAEINHLAGFNVSYEVIKRGRAVAAVKVSWGEKSATERKATKRELDSPKVGRKARRTGKVENIAPKASELPTGFPESGSISFGKWGELARVHLPKPTPDVDIVAAAFRRTRQAAKWPLNGSDVESHFNNFCKKWQQSHQG